MKVLETVLTQYTAQRIGVICHKVHMRTILGTIREGPSLPESLRSRIAKVEYYRVGNAPGQTIGLAVRSDHCAGHAEGPPSTIKTRLVQTGRTAAATHDGRWERDY